MLTAISCHAASFIVYLTIIMWGKMGQHNGEYFGYGLVSFYLVIPLTSFAAALVLKVADAYLSTLYPFLFGVLGLTIPIVATPKDIFPIILSDVWLLLSNSCICWFFDWGYN